MFENCGWLIVTVLTDLNRCVSLSSRTQKVALKFHLLRISSFMHAVYNIPTNGSLRIAGEAVHPKLLENDQRVTLTGLWKH